MFLLMFSEMAPMAILLFISIFDCLVVIVVVAAIHLLCGCI